MVDTINTGQAPVTDLSAEDYEPAPPRKVGAGLVFEDGKHGTDGTPTRRRELDTAARASA